MPVGRVGNYSNSAVRFLHTLDIEGEIRNVTFGAACGPSDIDKRTTEPTRRSPPFLARAPPFEWIELSRRIQLPFGLTPQLGGNPDGHQNFLHKPISPKKNESTVSDRELICEQEM